MQFTFVNDSKRRHKFEHYCCVNVDRCCTHCSNGLLILYLCGAVTKWCLRRMERRTGAMQINLPFIRVLSLSVVIFALSSPILRRHSVPLLRFPRCASRPFGHLSLSLCMCMCNPLCPPFLSQSPLEWIFCSFYAVVGERDMDGFPNRATTPRSAVLFAALSPPKWWMTILY